MKYQFTITSDDFNELTAVAKAIDAVRTAKTAPEAAVNKPPKANKPTNGKVEAETETKLTAEPDPAGDLAQALKICRALLDSGDAAKTDLKALRDEFGVKKLSDVPPESAVSFLSKVQALQDKHGA